MACMRCRLSPVVESDQGVVCMPLPGNFGPEELASENDALFPLALPRVLGASGPMSTPPVGSEPPRICGLCGVVYYPKVLSRTGRLRRVVHRTLVGQDGTWQEVTRFSDGTSTHIAMFQCANCLQFFEDVAMAREQHATECRR